jgi:hypothetical protein
MVMVAMMVAASTVHPHSATTAMASHKATRAIEEEIVAALTEVEAAEDQGDSIVAVTEVALVAEAMTATVVATTGITMMMTMTATKVAGDLHNHKLLQAASIKTPTEVVTLPNTLEREEECEVAHLAENPTVSVPKLPSQPLQTTSVVAKVVSRKEEAANHSKPIRLRPLRAQARSL